MRDKEKTRGGRGGRVQEGRDGGTGQEAQSRAGGGGWKCDVWMLGGWWLAAGGGCRECNGADRVAERRRLIHVQSLDL